MGRPGFFHAFLNVGKGVDFRAASTGGETYEVVIDRILINGDVLA